jgi:hypothetical protein
MTVNLNAPHLHAAGNPQKKGDVSSSGIARVFPHLHKDTERAAHKSGDAAAPQCPKTVEKQKKTRRRRRGSICAEESLHEM